MGTVPDAATEVMDKAEYASARWTYRVQGIGSDEPEYQIEIMPGEVPAPPPAPMYMDPGDSGWGLGAEPGRARDADPDEPLTLELEPDERAGYPTLCKGRFEVNDETYYALEEPTSLNTLELLPQLAQAGVVALKVEGRQRGVAYVRAVASTWRQAIDRYRADPQRWTTEAAWQQALGAHAEGQQTTLGPYHRAWH